jgi:hypothetical protein
MRTFIVPGRLPGMNEYTTACRSHWALGAKMKRLAQDEVCMRITGRQKVAEPVQVDFAYYEPNRKRDRDNVAGFAHKVIFDALVERGVLTGDGWGVVLGWTDRFAVDASFPRIEFTVREAVA